MPERIGQRVLSWASVLDADTREQALRLADVAAVEGHVALMPDAHLGKGTTVGSVIPTAEAIIPAAVGVDIGCGVIAARTDLTADELPDDLQPVLDRWQRDVPAGVGRGHTEAVRQYDELAAASGVPESVQADPGLRDKAAKQFGTLGSGNHFLELCLDEGQRVWLLLHSGSRGVGNALAMRHIASAKTAMRRSAAALPDPDLAYLEEGSAAFAAYVADLTWAQAYAYANRQRMLQVALAALGDRTGGAAAVQVINNHHNYARVERHHGKDLWITRKGAISARSGELGVIPGSMGTGSFVVRGLAEPSSYCSAAHGAGRAMSRRQARKRFVREDLERAMEGRTWLRAKAKALIDEIPAAYKPLDTVMADQADLVEVVHRLETVVNYKGT